MFGEEIRIEKGGKKVGLKDLDAYSDANTDDLADDSDLDTSTCMQAHQSLYSISQLLKGIIVNGLNPFNCSERTEEGEGVDEEGRSTTAGTHEDNDKTFEGG